MAGRKALSSNRALVLDTLHFASKVPTFPVEQTFDLRGLAAARRAARIRISWSVLFTKAYAIVASQRSVLRQAFIPWPWPHLYEQDEVVAALAIHRVYRGEDRLCWGRLDRPHQTSLVELQAALDRYQQSPVEEAFRRQIRLSLFPTPLRRIAWRIGLYLDLAKRARRFGVFSVSSLAGQGAINRFHPTFHTTSLTYGPLDERNYCLVTLICDHRVLDGFAAAQALNDLQAALQNQVAGELQQLARLAKAS